MSVHSIRQTLFPILAAFIWGTTFVAQSISTRYILPFAFNATRSLIAFFFLLLLSFLFRKIRQQNFANQAQAYSGSWRDLILGGICCGTVLTAATNLQQLGLRTTSASKAGFITALYIVIVPILGIFLHKKTSGAIWASVALAVVGMYCLCVQENFTIVPGDFYVFLCAIGFSAHILVIDHFTQKVDGVELSCAQFLVVAVLSGIGMLVTGSVPEADALRNCIWPLVYAGIFSSGIAYTLQILAQKDSNPTVVSLLLSLEAVFAALSGAVILHDRMSGREYFGCALMLTAVVLAQIPMPSRGKGPRLESPLPDDPTSDDPLRNERLTEDPLLDSQLTDKEK